jgi:spore coat polysaccharide biosynthesis protein SpsF
VLAIVQARMSSRRLPGKVLKPILGRPMLGLQLDRLRQSTMIDRFTVATSDDRSDDEVAAFCAAKQIDCYRGPLDDVLARYEGAARENDPIDHVVRLTADCPLIDVALIDLVVEHHLRGAFDYSSNTVRARYPDGLDVEIMKRTALRVAAAEASSPYDREHVTPFLYSQPERFRLGSVENVLDQRHMRWTVDTEADFRMVEAIFTELLPANRYFGWMDVLALLAERPDIAAINSKPA